MPDAPPRTTPRAAALNALRVRQWLHFMPLPLAGLTTPPDAASSSTLAAGVVGAALSLAFAYGLNAITDRGSDASAQKNPLRGLAVVPAEVGVVVALAAVLAGALAIFVLGPVAGAALGVSLLAGLLYSAGPRTKRTPVLGALTNVLIFTPLLFLGIPSTEIPPFAGLVVTFSVLLLQNQLLHEQADVEEDTRSADLSTARLLGETGVRWTTTALGLLSAPLVWLLEPSLAAGVLAGALLMGGGTLAWWVREPGRARRSHRGLALIGGSALFVVERLFAVERLTS